MGGDAVPPPPEPFGPDHPLLNVMAEWELSHRPAGDRFPKDVKDASEHHSPTIGRVHSMWKGNTLKFTCTNREHPKCQLMLQNHWFIGGEVSALCVGYRWLAAGRMASREDHAKWSRDASNTAKAEHKERRAGASSDAGMSSAASSVV